MNGSDRARLRAALAAFLIPYADPYETHTVLNLTADKAIDVLCGVWPDHFVVFGEDRWTVEHSFVCRLDGNMPHCAYHTAIERVVGDVPDPDDLGRWRITEIDSEGLPSLERA